MQPVLVSPGGSEQARRYYPPSLLSVSLELPGYRSKLCQHGQPQSVLSVTTLRHRQTDAQLTLSRRYASMKADGLRIASCAYRTRYAHDDAEPVTRRRPGPMLWSIVALSHSLSPPSPNGRELTWGHGARGPKHEKGRSKWQRVRKIYQRRHPCLHLHDLPAFLVFKVRV